MRAQHNPAEIPGYSTRRDAWRNPSTRVPCGMSMMCYATREVSLRSTSAILITFIMSHALFHRHRMTRMEAIFKLLASRNAQQWSIFCSRYGYPKGHFIWSACVGTNQQIPEILNLSEIFRYQAFERTSETYSQIARRLELCLGPLSSKAIIPSIRRQLRYIGWRWMVQLIHFAYQDIDTVANGYWEERRIRLNQPSSAYTIEDGFWSIEDGNWRPWNRKVVLALELPGFVHLGRSQHLDRLWCSKRRVWVIRSIAASSGW